MTAGEPSISPFGDAALLLTFEERIDRGINARVHALADALRAARASDSAWGAPVPGYASLLVPYDPLRFDHDEAAAALAELASAIGQAQPGDSPSSPERPLEISVRYGGDDGPDLAEVAERCGLSQLEVVRIHASTTYRAYLLGFAPGFAYLATLSPSLELPRRDNPRPRVPAGSVAIAGRQTAVYPLSTPGGWHLIGRTELPIWDARREPPALITPGREVRFVPLAG